MEKEIKRMRQEEMYCSKKKCMLVATKMLINCTLWIKVNVQSDNNREKYCKLYEIYRRCSVRVWLLSVIILGEKKVFYL